MKLPIQEYQTWWRATGLLVAVSLAGCGDDAQITEPEPMERIEPADISGVWDFTEVLVRSALVAACRDTGSFSFGATASFLSGEGEQVGTCGGVIGEFPNDRIFRLQNVAVDDSAISFEVESGCRYRGSIFAGPPVRMEGESACSINFDGNWVAFRGAPVASLDLLPDSVEVVFGETVFPLPVLVSQTGARVFKRPLTWTTSDAAVATVTDSGEVQGAGTGTAVVAVAVESLGAQINIASRFVDFVSVEVGQFHSCGISTDGFVYCWGVNDAGQVSSMPSVAPCLGVRCHRAPSRVAEVPQFVSVSAGFRNTCGVVTGGVVYCWGVNDAGQLGNGSSIIASDVPVAVSGGLVFSSVSVGTNHVCGVVMGGSVYCWGFNFDGELGTGSTESRNVPTKVTSSEVFVSVTGGERHTCGLTVNAMAYCWGFNFDGQLGADDSTFQSAVPLAVAGGLTLAGVSAGRLHTCGLATDGKTYCWGANRDGQLAQDSIGFSLAPLQVATAPDFSSITAAGRHTCGLTADGTAFCWGRGAEGQLGDAQTVERRTPVMVRGGLKFTSLSAGGSHTCGQATDGFLYCWGSNADGELGDNTLNSRTVPTKVVGQTGT